MVNEAFLSWSALPENQFVTTVCYIHLLHTTKAKLLHGSERHARRNPIDSGVYSVAIAW